MIRRLRRFLKVWSLVRSARSLQSQGRFYEARAYYKRVLHFDSSNKEAETYISTFNWLESPSELEQCQGGTQPRSGE